ncbi:MAG TPA: pentapeptide repeat-containing protein [Spirochaetia bacterium]|nr:pentapeptide repeat-containing protein [Spirochaetaceae bacterium]HPE89087.1 pentapeptide repeat-containing protein [Spirochaetales bacterium]HRW24627.1 pentapeptide repeat-containing protein [Spirochaetia bacterium]
MFEEDAMDGAGYDGVHFSDIPLDGKEFSRCSFRSCDFSSADLAGAEFSDCAFDECNFSNTVFAGCRFLDPTFTGCKLAGLSFFKLDQLVFGFVARECVIINCNFSDVKSKKSVMTKCVVKDSDFADADFQAADFTDTEFSGCVFHNVDLRKADFYGASGYEINPRTNDVRRAVFSMPHAIGLLCGLDIKIKD